MYRLCNVNDVYVCNTHTFDLCERDLKETGRNFRTNRKLKFPRTTISHVGFLKDSVFS